MIFMAEDVVEHSVKSPDKPFGSKAKGLPSGEWVKIF